MTVLNLCRILYDSAQATPHETALIAPEGSLSYQTLQERVYQWVRFLSRLEIQAGEKVGLLLYNDPLFAIGYFALLHLGATVIPLNTRLTAVELSAILNDAGTTWLITQDDFDEVTSELTVPNLQGILTEASLPTETPNSSPCEPVPVTGETLAALIYTSGTTGKPKGVMLSHRNLRADAEANAQVIEAVSQDRFVTISPLFHVFGQVNILLTALLVGASVVLVKKFSPRAVLEAIETHGVTFMAAVPTMYQMMLAHLEEGSYNLSSLRVCHSGAAPMAKETFRKVEEAFGAPVQEGYGLSESSSIITSNPLHGMRKPGSVGLPLPGVTLEVMDEAMQVLPPGEIGEIHVQGPVVMLGYYRQPEETQKALVSGWLKTKDMAYRDEDGYLFIVDRRDDMINIGGVKVFPREIEEVLYRHPAIHAVAVVGTPSTLYQEEIKAFVVLKNGVALTKSELQKFCHGVLAEYKIPKTVVFVDEIPQGATGKILRKHLRDAPTPTI